MSDLPYLDYRFKASSLAVLRAALDQLRTAGVISSDQSISHMLGDPQLDAQGQPSFRARKGTAARTWTDEDGVTHPIAALGDPNMWYIALRTVVAVSPQVFDPIAAGLTPCSAAESAQVLGVWA